MPRKPRWVKTRTYQLHQFDRYPLRFVTSADPWQEFTIAAAQIWTIPEPQRTINRIERRAPKRRTWRYR